MNKKRRLPLSRLPLGGRNLPPVRYTAHCVKVGVSGGHLFEPSSVDDPIVLPRTAHERGCRTASRRVISRCEPQRLLTTPPKRVFTKIIKNSFFLNPSTCWVPPASPSWAFSPCYTGVRVGRLWLSGRFCFRFALGVGPLKLPVLPAASGLLDGRSFRALSPSS